MLEPHTATFPCGSYSRKSGAAVAFQDPDASIKQHPWFTPRSTHTFSLSLPLPPLSISIDLRFSLSLFFFSLFWFFSPPLHSVYPSLYLSFCPSSSTTRLSLQPPGHFRQAVCNRFINRLFSRCSKHTVGFGGRLSDTDRLVLNLRNWLSWE